MIYNLSVAKCRSTHVAETLSEILVLLEGERERDRGEINGERERERERERENVKERRRDVHIFEI